MLPFLRPKLREGWLAVAYSTDRLDFAHVRRPAQGKPEVLLLDSCPRGEDDKAALQALRKDFKLGHYHCTALLREGEYQMLQIEPPNVPDTEVKEALRWQINDMLRFPAESASIDMLPIPADQSMAGRAKQAFAVAADNTLLAPRVAAFDAAKLALEAIDIPELAQRNISALFEEENRGLALLAFDDNGGLMTFTFAGELYASRHVNLPLAQFTDMTADTRAALFERIVLEAQRSLDNFDRQYGHITLKRLLVSPVPEMEALLAYLREQLPLPVEVLDLGTVLDFPAIQALAEPMRQSQCLKVLGAALRDAAA